jgi:hypothetical protein
MDNTEPKPAPEVVLMAKLPLAIDRLMEIANAATAAYGKDIFMLTDHPDSKTHVVFARD